MAIKQYDLIVIGSGSGLNVVSAAVNQFNWQVAVIEKGPLGGTCLNRGCIPSKMLIHSADIAETITNSSIFGITSSISQIDFASITNRANTMVDAESFEIETSLKKHPNIDLYQTEANFTDARTLIVNEQEIRGDRVLIAAGTRPSIPTIPGLEHCSYWTSTEALRQTSQPRSLVIIGGGYIGMELGHFYGALGTKITILEEANTLLTKEDKDIAQRFTQVFSNKYDVHLNVSITTISQDLSGEKTVSFKTMDGKEQLLETDGLLIATGTRPNSDTLTLENANIQVDDNGFISVNEFMETSIENVWALGDIVGKAPFKHGANYESQIVYRNMTSNSKIAADYTIMPRAVFSSPQVASVGITEQEAQKREIEYEVRTHEYLDTAMGKALEAASGFVKFIIDPKEQKILGCHILGPEAATLIHEVAIVMQVANGDIRAIKNTVHIHPALNEVLQRAL